MSRDNKPLIDLTVLLTIVLLSAASVNALFAGQSFCEFLHIIDRNTTRFNEAAYFWTHDTLDGPVHINDFYCIFYSPQFLSTASTSETHYVSFRAEPFFSQGFLTGAPIRRFPEEFTAAREQGLVFDADENSQYRLVLDNDVGLVYRWIAGMPFDVEADPDETIEIAENPCLFFNHPLELKGVLDGVLTIGCSRDIRLIDNVRYAASEEVHGQFDPEECDDILGIVSEQNIVIADTWENGREDGIHVAPDDYDRHSIIINGALLTLLESFTIEHQNDEWEFYQGPEPDERGHIFLSGCIAQKRPGYVHRSNHDGTGYSHFIRRYDTRLAETPPPFFPEITQQDIPGEGNFLHLNSDGSPYRLLRRGSYETVTAEPGTEIILTDTLALNIRNWMRFEGNAENPITIRRENPDEFPTAIGVNLTKGDSSTTFLSYVHTGPGSRIKIEERNVVIENCILEGGIELTGSVSEVMIRSSEIHGEFHIEECVSYSIENSTFTHHASFNAPAQDALCEISNSRFEAGFTQNGRGSLFLTGSVVEGQIEIDGLCSCALRGNTQTGSDEAGLKIENAVSVDALNNIFTGNQYGIWKSEANVHIDLTLGYNDCWDNEEDYFNAEPGDGSISEDPMFVDEEASNYYLQPISPCIDAGAPFSPLDPDSSRADIGAFPYHHPVTIEHESAVATDFSCTASPNPFNSQTTLTFSGQLRGLCELTVYDVEGREIYNKDFVAIAGQNRMILNGEQLGTAGIYYARLSAKQQNKVLKVVYLP